MLNLTRFLYQIFLKGCSLLHKSDEKSYLNAENT